MISILTGKPGTGKTAYAVKMLLEDPTLKDRPIFTNITGLKLPHHPIDADWLRDWHHNAPPEAFILYDECQDVFVPRHVSKEPPPYVNELTKHRKDYSVDFFLITQKPSFVDHMVRGLAQRHIHIRETGLTRMVHEAPEVVDFEDKAVREVSSGTPYSLPKHVFDLYTSAQVHTKKQRRRLPTAFYVFAFAAVLSVALGIYLYQNKISPHLGAGPVEGEQGGGLPPPAASTLSASAPVPTSIVEATTPTDPHNPLSAPLYASAAPPVVAPQIVGCIASRVACTCYSQQTTPVWIPEEQCRRRAAGLYYDPYQQPPPADQNKPQSTTVAAASPGEGDFAEGKPAGVLTDQREGSQGARL